MFKNCYGLRRFAFYVFCLTKHRLDIVIYFTSCYVAYIARTMYIYLSIDERLVTVHIWAINEYLLNSFRPVGPLYNFVIIGIWSVFIPKFTKKIVIMLLINSFNEKYDYWVRFYYYVSCLTHTIKDNYLSCNCNKNN